MNISEILKVNNKLCVYGLSFRAEACEDADLFFCLSSDDGKNRQSAMTAYERGAAALVAEKKIDGIPIPQFIVPDVRSELALAAHRFFGKPSEKLTMIGVTGTNGKTTTAYIIKSIMDAAGHKTGLIGTNEITYGARHFPPRLTTPDPIDLHRILAEMASKGVDTVVMEVSAHALALRKTDGIVFSVAALTNLTPDHLDFFGDMDNYKDAKLRLFDQKRSSTAVVNVDDALGLEIYRAARLPLVTYGCENPSDVFGINFTSSEDGCAFVANILDGIINVKYCGAGRFNMYNVLCAAAVASVLGVQMPAMSKGIAAVKGVPGRFNIIKSKDKTVVIDYAHTPDGLLNIISAVREFTPGRVITVFGCGGDRDRSKRAVMGEIAADLSDFTVITSDNPRSEPPMSIISEIERGTRKPNYEVEQDRERAICKAMELCRGGDTVIIAGKGHENTQEIGGTVLRFSDEEIVKRLLK